MSSGHTTTHDIRCVPASSARELHRRSLVSARRQLTAAHSKQVGSRASLRRPRGRLNSYKRLEPEAVLAQILKVSCNRLGAQLFDLSEKGYMVLISFMLIREHLNDHIHWQRLHGLFCKCTTHLLMVVSAITRPRNSLSSKHSA